MSIALESRMRSRYSWSTTVLLVSDLLLSRSDARLNAYYSLSLAVTSWARSSDVFCFTFLVAVSGLGGLWIVLGFVDFFALWSVVAVFCVVFVIF
jgi:hypothetical protein